MSDQQFRLGQMIQTSLATCWFNLKSSFSIQRISVSLVMALFPPVMLMLAIFGARSAEGPNASIPFVEFLIVLLVSIICLLSLLLWATPNVYSELESKTWIFIASRPRGRLSCLFGKFLAAFISAFALSFFAVTTCVFLADQFIGLENPLNVWASLTGVYFLACWTYSAIFSMIGTITIKRAMVFSAGFVIFWEAILASFPSVISKLTVRYHLQSLGFEWMGWFIPSDIMPMEAYTEFYGEPVVWFNVSSLLAISGVCLLVGCIVITFRQYITVDESN